MSAAAQILKNFQLSIDGRFYAGNVDSIQLPALVVKNEEYRAGGMDAPVALDMGMEKLESTVKMSNWNRDVANIWGLGPGATKMFVFRGALESLNGTVEPVVITMSGTLDSLEHDDVQPGAKAGVTLKISVRQYKYEQNGVTVHDIDVLNMKRIVNGVDRLLAIRTAIGL
jgi:hypothetical protein